MQTPIRKDDPEELAKALRYVMVKVGLRASNWPTQEEEEVLFAHILTEYGNHTASEIRLAFDMAIVGKLDIDRKEVVCYENFSCLYFSGIMNAYRKWASQAYRHVVKQEKSEGITYPKWEIGLEWSLHLLKQLKSKLLPPLV